MTIYTKPQLRELALKNRSAIPPAEMEQAALGLRDNFLKSVDLPAGCYVSAYLPCNCEISPLPLCDALIERGYNVLMPGSWEGAGMDFTLLPFLTWTRKTPTLRNVMGIEEPDPRYCMRLIPDIYMVPLLAFDAKGNRLNYGTGYWDRTFGHMKRAGMQFKAIGIGYESQRYDSVPVDGHDYVLDMCVTDQRAYTFK